MGKTKRSEKKRKRKKKAVKVRKEWAKKEERGCKSSSSSSSYSWRVSCRRLLLLLLFFHFFFTKRGVTRKSCGFPPSPSLKFTSKKCKKRRIKSLILLVNACDPSLENAEKWTFCVFPNFFLLLKKWGNFIQRR